MSDKVSEKLDNINKTLEKILAVMDKPEKPLLKVLTLVGVIVGTLGIVHVIDTVANWFGGR